MARKKYEIGDAIRMHKNGLKVHEIAKFYGVLPNGVSQRMRRAGYVAGRHGRSEEIAAIYGCTEDQFEALSAYSKSYQQQRKTALFRGISWNMTFPEWYSVWLESGHIDHRGTTLGSYCMARTGDVGPYEIGNVRITTVSDNHIEYHTLASAKGYKRRTCALAVKVR